MQPETPFRLALLGMFLLTMPIIGYRRWRASRSGERISRQSEGLLIAVPLRLAGLCLWLCTLAFLIDPAWMAWGQVRLPSWIRWCGAVVGLLVPAMMYWTLRSLGTNLTDTVVTRAEARLVTTGPYRFVRHPFYVTAALLFLAATLLTANLAVGLCGVAIMLLLVIRTPKEEQQLIDKFGDEYRAYMTRTGRFWPKLR